MKVVGEGIAGIVRVYVEARLKVGLDVIDQDREVRRTVKNIVRRFQDDYDLAHCHVHLPALDVFQTPMGLNPKLVAELKGVLRHLFLIGAAIKPPEYWVKAQPAGQSRSVLFVCLVAQGKHSIRVIIRKGFLAKREV